MPQQFMTPQEAEIFLASNFIGQLATSGKDGYPYTVPIDYVYWEKKIYLHCALEGQKLDNITRNPNVCFTVYRVDKIDIKEIACKSAARYHSVQVFGKAFIIEDPLRKAGILNAFMEHFASGRPFEAISEEKASTCAVIEIQPERISGKRNIEPA
jgi:nitroimidazol reductase NimA-like FMN-containing flavoprotein (pyridoxamine 5'-phosphate oxidase superfamily)